MTLNEGAGGGSVFHWLRLLVLKLYGTLFVPATLEFNAVSVAPSRLFL